MLDNKINEAWDFVWEKLFWDETNLFYDYRTSLEQDGVIRSLPSPEEIALDIPNPCGWGTGMEDSMLNNGSMLEATIARYSLTGDSKMKRCAVKLFAGMKTCATISKSKGFLARSVSPVDGRSHYSNSSRDQYTHWVYAGWFFYHSGLSSEIQKEDIRNILVSFAERAEKNVTENTGYNLLREDGKNALVCQMWRKGIGAHEYLRLPMIYAAAADVTGDEHWKDLYEKYRTRALSESFKLEKEYQYAYALLQMQYSLRLLYEVENVQNIKKEYKKLMGIVANMAERYAISASQRLSPEDIEMFSRMKEPWRKRPFRYLNQKLHGNLPYFCPEWDEIYYMKTFKPLRETGEGIIIQMLCPDRSLPQEQLDAFCKVVEKVNFAKHTSYAPILLIDAYWLICAASRNNIRLDTISQKYSEAHKMTKIPVVDLC